MSSAMNGASLTLVAAADLSAKQFFAIKIDSAGKAALAAAGEPCIGILQNNPTAGQVATVMFNGESKAKAGGSITAGSLIASDVNGKFVVATAGRTKTDDAGAAVDPLIGSCIIGIARTDAASGDLFSLAIARMGVAPTTYA